MKRHPTIVRGGVYYRVVAPDWVNPADTTYARNAGGRWNPPGEFGALYLNANVSVAAANARARHAGRAIKIFDLVPAARPELVAFAVPDIVVVDACTASGIAHLGFRPNFPHNVDWVACQTIAREAHAAGLEGVASHSAAEVTAYSFVGEELAVFEQINVGPPQSRVSFSEWYPDPIPG